MRRPGRCLPADRRCRRRLPGQEGRDRRYRQVSTSPPRAIPMAIFGSSVGGTPAPPYAAGPWTFGNGQHNTVYIVDVDGTRQVIDTMYVPGVSARTSPNSTRSSSRSASSRGPVRLHPPEPPRSWRESSPTMASAGRARPGVAPTGCRKPRAVHHRPSAMTTASRFFTALVLIAAPPSTACSSSAGTTQPSAPPSGPPVPITTPEGGDGRDRRRRTALRRDRAREPGPHRPGRRWYEAEAGVRASGRSSSPSASDGATASRAASNGTPGPTPSPRTGRSSLLSEAGDPVPPERPADRRPPRATTGIVGHATAGPICPVERPGDPACEPRPVAERRDRRAGRGWRRGGADTDERRWHLRLPVPAGDYVVVGLAGRRADGRRRNRIR